MDGKKIDSAEFLGIKQLGHKYNINSTERKHMA